MEEQLGQYFLAEQASAIRKVASLQRGMEMTRALNELLPAEAQDRLVQRFVLVLR